MAFASSIVNGRLPIFVLSVHIVTTLLAEEADHVKVTLTRCIEDRRLLQCILLGRAKAKSNEHFDHLERQVCITDYTSCKEQGLTEVFRIIEHSLDVDSRLADDASDLIELTPFSLLEESLVEGILLSLGRCSLGCLLSSTLNCLSLICLACIWLRFGSSWFLQVGFWLLRCLRLCWSLQGRLLSLLGHCGLLCRIDLHWLGFLPFLFHLDTHQ